jgi:hypothetical protein
MEKWAVYSHIVGKGLMRRQSAVGGFPDGMKMPFTKGFVTARELSAGQDMSCFANDLLKD